MAHLLEGKLGSPIIDSGHVNKNLILALCQISLPVPITPPATIFPMDNFSPGAVAAILIKTQHTLETNLHKLEVNVQHLGSPQLLLARLERTESPSKYVTSCKSDLNCNQGIKKKHFQE